MQLFGVPKWLRGRKILQNDLGELQQLFFGRDVPVVSDLTVEQLKQFYQEQPKVIFYKVVRLFGFYGVIFSGKLSSYSGPYEINPELLKISILDRQRRLADYTDTPSLVLLGSCGIVTLEQLHGVPVQSLKKLLECSTSSFEDLLKTIPSTLVPATSNFFISDRLAAPVQLGENELPKIIAKVFGQPLEILNLAVRSYNCLW